MRLYCDSTGKIKDLRNLPGLASVFKIGHDIGEPITRVEVPDWQIEQKYDGAWEWVGFAENRIDGLDAMLRRLESSWRDLRLVGSATDYRNDERKRFYIARSSLYGLTIYDRITQEPAYTQGASTHMVYNKALKLCKALNLANSDTKEG